MGRSAHLPALLSVLAALAGCTDTDGAMAMGCDDLAALRPGPPIADHPLLQGSDQDLVEALGRAVGDEPTRRPNGTPDVHAWAGRNGTFDVVRTLGGDLLYVTYAMPEQRTEATEAAIRAELERVLAAFGFGLGSFEVRGPLRPDAWSPWTMLASHRVGPYLEQGAVELEVGTPLAAGTGQTYRVGAIHEDAAFAALTDAALARHAEGHARCALREAGLSGSVRATSVSDAVAILGGVPRLDVILSAPDPCGERASVQVAVEVDPRTGALVSPTAGWGRCVEGD